MNIHKLRMDTSGNVEDISFVLAKKNGDKLGNITNVDNIVTKHSMKEASEFIFAAHKKIGNSIIKIEKCSSPIGDGNSYSNLETVTFGNKVNCY